MCNDPRLHDVTRTTAAVVYAQLRDKPAEIDLLIARTDDDVRFRADVARQLAVLGCVCAYELKDSLRIFGFYALTRALPMFTEDDLRKRKVQRELAKGIHASAVYIAEANIAVYGRERALLHAEQAVQGLAAH